MKLEKIFTTSFIYKGEFRTFYNPKDITEDEFNLNVQNQLEYDWDLKEIKDE